jgi:hypothetical protein
MLTAALGTQGPRALECALRTPGWCRECGRATQSKKKQSSIGPFRSRSTFLLTNPAFTIIKK